MARPEPTRPRRAPLISRALSVTELERIWRLDSGSPAEPRRSQTRIVVRRSSAHDLKNDQVHVSIDDRPFAALRYGEVSAQVVEPGRHTVRVSNRWLGRALVVDVAQACPSYLQCGTGVPPGRWLPRLLSRLSGLNVWLVLEPEG